MWKKVHVQKTGGLEELKQKLSSLRDAFLKEAQDLKKQIQELKEKRDG